MNKIDPCPYCQGECEAGLCTLEIGCSVWCIEREPYCTYNAGCYPTEKEAIKAHNELCRSINSVVALKQIAEQQRFEKNPKGTMRDIFDLANNAIYKITKEKVLFSDSWDIKKPKIEWRREEIK